MESEHMFLLAVFILIPFIAWAEIQLGINVIASGSVNTTLEMPQYNETGVFGYLGFLTSLSSLGSGFMFMNIFLYALSGAIVFIVVKMILGIF